MADEDTRKRLHRLLKRDLGPAVNKTGRGTWMTTSNLPHEIRLHEQDGVQFVRVSAGVVIGVKANKPLLKLVNALNVERAFSRRIVGESKVLVVAEMPVASLRKGDLEHLVSMVLCTARLDAPILAAYGGRPVTDPPPELAPDLEAVCADWRDVLRASGTATKRELAVWIDDAAEVDCWIDRDDEGVAVVLGATGMTSQYPFALKELLVAADALDDGDGWDHEG